MRIHLNMTDDELIQRMIEAPKYLNDREDIEELIKRFQDARGKVYQYEAIMDDEGVGYDAIEQS